MASIDIRRRHNKSLKDARKAVEHVAQRMAEKFAVDYSWEGNTLHFNRAGVDGRIALERDEVHVEANLGFFLSALKGPIEQEIHRRIETEFA
ncbi:MAG: polyhydroxyalkanoic acid system family protein [Lysobacteraceae bacterium]